MYSYNFHDSQEPLGNRSQNGTCEDNAIDWILHIFDECVYTTREEVGFIFGLISICCWVCASVPQLIENYKKKHVEEAISFAFLLFWLFGDSSNLIGCILTHQFPIQLYTAVYYVGMDIVMILQYLYYYCKHKNARNADTSLGNNNGVIPPVNIDKHSVMAAVCFMCFMPIPILSNWNILFPANEIIISDSKSMWKSRNILSTAKANAAPLIPDDPEEIIGYIVGCVSSVFYLGSRLPQIIKNFKRHETEGVAISMFILAVLGNALYGSAILLQEPVKGHSRLQFFVAHMPWLVGSLGTMSLDFTILGQIIYYNHRPACCRSRNYSEDEEPLLV